MQDVIYRVRSLMHDHPRGLLYAGVAAAAVVLVALGILIFALGGGRESMEKPPLQVWFYDLNTAAFFAAEEGTITPTTTASGPTPSGSPAGVLAYVYACGGCGDPSGGFGYFEAVKEVAGADPITLYQPHGLSLGKFPDGGWYTGDEVFRAINDAIWGGGRCGLDKPTFCTPANSETGGR